VSFSAFEGGFGELFMAELIIHRGGHEIGGSAIEIRTSNVRVLFDLGSPLDFKVKTETDAASLKKNWRTG